MQYEGEHKLIVLRGIERSMANGMPEDGGMEEATNVLPRNGSYVPYSANDVERAYAPYLIQTVEESGVTRTVEAKMVRVHHTSTGDNTIIVYDNFYLVNPVDGNDGRRDDVEVDDIVFIGNRMDLSTSTGIEHWLWKNGEYVNQDDLKIHENGESVLPSVSFKVSRGIYDGSKVYSSAKYVKVHKHFTDYDSEKCNQGELSKYVRELGSVGGDAMALLDSIRHMGGITGYVLVAAAWRVKGSSVTNPRYVMASPVLLMGAPEIYTKDGKYESPDGLPYIGKPQESDGQGGTKAKTYFLDMFDYSCDNYNDIDDADFDVQAEAFDTLWNIEDSDDRDIEDLSESEHVFIEPLEEDDPCIIREELSASVPTAGGGPPYSSKRYYRTVNGVGQSMAVWSFSEKTNVHLPSLCSRKYAMYNHGDDGYRGVRITHGSGNVLYFKLNEALQEQYKDEVDRLCIFVSPIISPYKTNSTSGVRFESNYQGERTADTYYDAKYDGFFFGNEIRGDAMGVHHSGCGGSFSPVMKSADEIRDEIKNVVGLYKLAEVQLNELGEGADANGWVKVDLSDGRLATDRMVQKSDTMLKISDLQPVGFMKGGIFGYNERLHVYNFQKNDVFRLPYESMVYYDGEGQYHVTDDPAYTKDYAIEVVDSNGSLATTRFSSSKDYLNPLISCPDIDSKSIRIVKGEGNQRAGYVNLTPIEIASIVGGVISSDLRPVSVSMNSVGNQEAYDAYYREDNILPDSYAWGKNELRVSETMTTIFELDKSYRFGHGEIIGLARLAIGLSQDNYSKFPLIVFCTDGVYSLGVDASGKYAYTGQTPLSRVVCTNKNGICEIDGAVLFPSEYGLHIATSDGVKPVALEANGEPKNMPTVYGAEHKGLEVYRNAISHEKIVDLLNSIWYHDFRDYVNDQNTHIRYLHALNSAVVYNKAMLYSYVIALDSWRVTKIDKQLLMDNADYPKQTFHYRLSDGLETHMGSVVFDYVSGDVNTECLLVSRPIALGTRHLKTVYRVVLRGAFEHVSESEGDEKYAGFYVFGSLDGNLWDYLNGSERLLTDNRFHDIGVETHHVSYKYMMVVFAGSLSKDSHIDGLEITDMVKYNNKLK